MEVQGDVNFYLEKNNEGTLIATRRYFLHSQQCKNSEQDIAIMKCKLLDDPECLIRKTYSLPASNTEKCTALFDAVYKDHDKCVDFMINFGANVHEIYRWYDIIETCLYRHRNKTLKYLIYSKIVDPVFNPNNSGIVNSLNASNYYLLVAVKKECTLDIINLFLKLGIKVDDYLNFDLELNHCPFKMPTVCAIESCRPIVLKMLLLHGGAIDSRQFKNDILSGEAKDCLSLIHHFSLFPFTNLKDSLLLLNILYEFGTNLWEKNRHGMIPIEVRQNPTALQRELLVRRIRMIDNDESDKVAVIVTEKMQEFMYKTLSLKSWSRIAIVRDKGLKYPSYVENLEGEVPREVLKFLRADDLSV